jgi:hypothetical protein
MVDNASKADSFYNTFYWVLALVHSPAGGLILRDARKSALLRMRNSIPHGEERGNAARLKP